MALNDIRVQKHGLTVMRFDTEANVDVDVQPGDAIKGAAGTGTNYVTVCLDGDPEQETDMFLGVSSGASTHTSSADGILDVEICMPGTILELKANTTSNVNTDAKILALKFDQVTFDRSAATAAGTLTLDEDEGSDTDVHGIMILDGRASDGMMFVTPVWGITNPFGEVTQA